MPGSASHSRIRYWREPSEGSSARVRWRPVSVRVRTGAKISARFASYSFNERFTRDNGNRTPTRKMTNSTIPRYTTNEQSTAYTLYRYKRLCPNACLRCKVPFNFYANDITEFVASYTRRLRGMSKLFQSPRTCIEHTAKNDCTPSENILFFVRRRLFGTCGNGWSYFGNGRNRKIFRNALVTSKITSETILLINWLCPNCVIFIQLWNVMKIRNIVDQYSCDRQIRYLHYLIE